MVIVKGPFQIQNFQLQICFVQLYSDILTLLTLVRYMFLANFQISFQTILIYFCVQVDLRNQRLRFPQNGNYKWTLKQLERFGQNKLRKEKWELFGKTLNLSPV